MLKWPNPADSHKEHGTPSTHTHQCGRVVWGMLPGYGCGHIWTHTAKPGPVDIQAHKCPQCGAGPFLFPLPEPPPRFATVYDDDGFKMRVRSAV